MRERRRVIENKAANLFDSLYYGLQGNKFETARVKCTYRKTTAIETDDTFIYWAQEHAPDLLRYTEPTPNKTKIKDAIKAGREIEHAKIVDGLSLSIK